MHPLFLLGGGEEGVDIPPIFEEGGSLTGSQFLEGATGKKGDDLFQTVAVFT